MRIWALCLVLGLAGCAATPEPAPQPPAPLPAPVVCALPAGMSEPEPPPQRPEGEYTQRDVAEFVAELHRWGSRGWEKLARARHWSQDCVDGTAVRDGGGPR